jgi:hypothetical protein
MVEAYSYVSLQIARCAGGTRRESAFAALTNILPQSKGNSWHLKSQNTENSWLLHEFTKEKLN